MTDLRVDALIGRLDIAAVPDPAFEARTLSDLLPRVHEARRRDARPLVGILARLRWPVEDARTTRVAWLLIAGLLVASAVWVAALVGSRPRLPEPFGPAANGLIVLGDGTHIVAMGPDGSGRHALTTGPGVDTQPAVSLDGSRIAFLRTESGRRSLVVADIAGSSERVALAADALGDLSLILDQPAWSPDGRRLAVSVLVPGPTAGTEHVEIGLVAVDGSGYERVLPMSLFSAEQAAWSPDGTQLAFLGEPASTPGSSLLYMSAPDGTDLRYLSARVSSGSTGYLQRPRWSPDGSRITVHYGDADYRDHDVLIVDVDAIREETVSGSALDETQPEFSPDGRQLALLRSTSVGSSQYRVVILDLDERTERTLESFDIWPDTIHWSPDGTQISVLQCLDRPSCELWLLDAADTTPPIRLGPIVTANPAVAYSTASWSQQRLAP